MKAQCPHCFKYEQRIAELEEENAVLRKQNMEGIKAVKELEEEVKKGMLAALKLERVREIVK